MKRLIILLTLNISLSSNAANWDLFPLNQKSYYLTGEWYLPDPYIEMIQFDTVYSQQGRQIFLNMKRLWSGSSSGCLNHPQPSLWYYYNSFIDTFSVENDTTKFNSKFNSNSLFFLSHASPGDSWTFNGYTSITVTCTSAIVDTIFGINDSMKIFTLDDNGYYTTDSLISHPFKLSKTFGLVNFVSFEDLMYVQGLFKLYQLIGVEDSVQMSGYRQPVFTEFFPYHQGDVLLWEDPFITSVFPLMVNYSYHRDSITSVTVYADSLIYTYDRTSLNSNGQVSNYYGITNRIKRSQEGKLLETAPFLIANFNNNIFPNYGIYLLNDSLLGNTYQRMSFTGGDQLDPINCVVLSPSDYYDEVFYSTRYGFEKHCSYYYEPDVCFKLIAASLNGTVYGNLNLPVGVGEMVSRNIIDVYPSPATDYVYFKTNTDSVASLQIFNSMGKIVLSMDGINLSEPVNLSSLASGIYFATLQIQGEWYHSRIVRL